MVTDVFAHVFACVFASVRYRSGDNNVRGYMYMCMLVSATAKKCTLIFVIVYCFSVTY